VLPYQLLVRSAYDVPDSDAAFSPGPLNLVEVDTKLLGLLLRGLRGVRLLLPTGRLLRRLLSLLGSLPCCILSLSGRLSRGVLRLLGSLPCLIGSLPRGLTCRLLRLVRHLSCLVGCLPRGLLGLTRCLAGSVLHTLRGLAHLVRDPTERTSSALLIVALLAAGKAAHGVLHLTRRLAGLIGDLPRGVLGLPCRLAGSVLHLTCYLTGLVGCLPRCVLRLLGRTLREVRHLLLRALGSLVHLILDTLVLGRLVYGPFELHVVVGHLLDLGLGIAVGELLGVLLELLAVVLDLALQAADRLRVEVLRVLLRLLLDLLLKVQALGHAVSFLRSLSCSQRGRT
jgi:hypothetical protein